MDPKVPAAKQLYTRACPECGELTTTVSLAYSLSCKKPCFKCGRKAMREKCRTKEHRELVRQNVKNAWADENSVFNSKEYRNKLCEIQQRVQSTPEAKEVKSLNSKKMWENKTQEEKDKIFTSQQTPETKAKRNATKAKLDKENPEFRKRQGQKMKIIMKDPEYRKRCTDKMISAAMKTSGVSKKERVLAETLVPLGWVHTYKIANCHVDFYNPNNDTVIEYFGDWWHCHPRYDKILEERYNNVHPNMGITPQKKRNIDILRIIKIEAACSKVIVVWESELKTKSIKEILSENNLQSCDPLNTSLP